MNDCSAIALAAYIETTSAQRYRVIFKGQIILDDVTDPEYSAARQLRALGYTGKLLTYFNGRPSMTLDIDRAALLTTSEGPATRLRVVKWRPFDKDDRSKARPRCEPS